MQPLGTFAPRFGLWAVVTLLLLVGGPALAQEPNSPLQAGEAPWYRSEIAEQVELPLEMMAPRNAPFRDSPYGDRVHYGNGVQPSSGYPNYEMPMQRYDMWYLPRLFGITRRERCMHRGFNPNGYGNLFAEPSTQYRMDYRPHVVNDHDSSFGPAYYRRQPERHCPRFVDACLRGLRGLDLPSASFRLQVVRHAPVSFAGEFGQASGSRCWPVLVGMWYK